MKWAKPALPEALTILHDGGEVAVEIELIGRLVNTGREEREAVN